MESIIDEPQPDPELLQEELNDAMHRLHRARLHNENPAKWHMMAIELERRVREVS